MQLFLFRCLSTLEIFISLSNLKLVLFYEIRSPLPIKDNCNFIQTPTNVLEADTIFLPFSFDNSQWQAWLLVMPLTPWKP